MKALSLSCKGTPNLEWEDNAKENILTLTCKIRSDKINFSVYTIDQESQETEQLMNGLTAAVKEAMQDFCHDVSESLPELSLFAFKNGCLLISLAIALNGENWSKSNDQGLWRGIKRKIEGLFKENVRCEIFQSRDMKKESQLLTVSLDATIPLDADDAAFVKSIDTIELRDGICK